MDDEVTGYEPAQALAQVQAARTALLETVERASWRYDIAYSLLAALVVLAQALPMGANVAGDALVLVALAWLARWWRARTGIWIHGMTPDRARWASLGIAVLAGFAALSAAIAAHEGRPWIALALAPVVGVVALGGSRLWRRLFREEIQTGQPSGSSPRALASWPLVVLGVVVAAIAAALALAKVESYEVGLVVGVASALLASPWLMRLKRRLGR